jgi:hypothetical protein
MTLPTLLCGSEIWTLMAQQKKVLRPQRSLLRQLAVSTSYNSYSEEIRQNLIFKIPSKLLEIIESSGMNMFYEWTQTRYHICFLDFKLTVRQNIGRISFNPGA